MRNPFALIDENDAYIGKRQTLALWWTGRIEVGRHRGDRNHGRTSSNEHHRGGSTG